MKFPLIGWDDGQVQALCGPTPGRSPEVEPATCAMMRAKITTVTPIENPQRHADRQTIVPFSLAEGYCRDLILKGATLEGAGTASVEPSHA